MQRRSGGPILDPDIVFPPLEVFDHPKKLPTTKSVIGVIRYLTEDKLSHSSAIKIVSKLVYAKYGTMTLSIAFLSEASIENCQDYGTYSEREERGRGKKAENQQKSTSHLY